MTGIWSGRRLQKRAFTWEIHPTLEDSIWTELEDTQLGLEMWSVWESPPAGVRSEAWEHREELHLLLSPADTGWLQRWVGVAGSAWASDSYLWCLSPCHLPVNFESDLQVCLNVTSSELCPFRWHEADTCVQCTPCFPFPVLMLNPQSCQPVWNPCSLSGLFPGTQGTSRL